MPPKDWLSKKAEFAIKTSGSTDKPKTIVFKRAQLQKSAHRTLQTLGLNKGDRVLMCLNPNFVAGKMMLVRALEGRLNLQIVSPSANPLRKIKIEQQFEFASFFTNQIERILEESPSKLEKINTILIGGGALHPKLEQDLQKVKSRILHSYATTETLSHQALRHVNGKDRSHAFHAVRDVSFAKDERSCLVINDHLLGLKHLVTNDIVELIDASSFRWRGRFDNIVNSGGIKIQLEETEDLIKELLTKRGLTHQFCLLAKPDLALSQKLVLIIGDPKNHLSKSQLLDLLKEQLPKYHAPKEIILVPTLYFTKTGKIDRKKNEELYLKID